MNLNLPLLEVKDLHVSINDNEIQVTFSSTEDAQKAYWINVPGVGK